MLKTIKHNWFQFKGRYLSYVIAYAGKYALKAILCTCRIHVQGLEKFIQTVSTKPCILMLWHSRLALVAEVFNTHAPQFIYTALISKSRDGAPLAHLVESYAAGRTIRVSHHSKHQALKQVIDNLRYKKEIIVFTPDGPRGPKCQVKPGIAMAARESKAAVIPFTWTADKMWQLNTWDRMMLPKPFSSIQVTIGEPIDLDESEPLETSLSTLERLLHQISG